MAITQHTWNPLEHGLSVSGLQLWLQDRFAFRAKYIEGWEPVEPWNNKLAYGSLFQSGIEGYIKSDHQIRGALRFIQQACGREIDKYNLVDEISWWSKLACHQISVFIDYYKDDPYYNLSLITNSERHLSSVITLPSSRKIKLHGYIDGEGDGLLFENKVRGNWDTEVLANNLALDLQYNYYCLLLREEEKLPTTVWYQTCRRATAWGFKGPRRKKRETSEEFLDRVSEHMTSNPEYYFYRYLGKPTETDLDLFCSAALTPMLEAFLDWHEHQLKIQMGIESINKTDWMTPYGLYNPFVEGTIERYRNYRLTGSTIGLKQKQH